MKIKIIIMVICGLVLLSGCLNTYNENSVPVGVDIEPNTKEIYLYPAVTQENTYVLNDTKYELWMNHVYLGVFNANRTVPFAIREYDEENNTLQTRFPNSLKIPAESEFEGRVFVDHPDKGDKYIYDEMIRFRTGNEDVIIITPTLHAGKSDYDFRAYDWNSDEYYFEKKEINITSLEEREGIKRLDLEIRVTPIDYTDLKETNFHYFGCEFGVDMIKSQLESDSEYVSQRFDYYGYGNDWDIFNAIQNGDKIRLMVEFNSDVTTSSFNCYVYDDSLWYNRKEKEFIIVPFDDKMNDLGAKNIKIPIRVNVK